MIKNIVARIPRKALLASLVVLDGFLAALSVPLAVALRIEFPVTPHVEEAVILATAIFPGLAVLAFAASGLYRRVWRYASISELLAVVKAATFAILGLMVVMFIMIRLEGLPRSVPIIQWLLLIAMLGMARLAPRLIREGGFISSQPGESVAEALLVGTGDGANLFLQALRNTATPSCTAIGILDPSSVHLGLSLRGVPVLGTPRELPRVMKQLRARGRVPSYLVLTDSAWEMNSAAKRDLINQSESLGLEIRRLPSLTKLNVTSGTEIDLEPIKVTDLLGRPQAVHDLAPVEQLIAGRRVMITGAGGSIGGELTRQIATLRPAQLILLDACEFNLYEIDLALKETIPGLPRETLLSTIRDRERIMQIFERHRPDLIFHAAALKHVPLVELNPCEGVLTNVLGTANVADAACRYGALAMVQVSSDKVVNPTSTMGASKRLAELYCQALDLDGAAAKGATRFMTVRFGNVLGSSGSLIPLFERQLKRGGPLTVTHPEMKRFFMTIREAVELVLQASAHGLQRTEGLGEIFVLDMGEPIKILDIAKRMIRMAGLEPDHDIKIDIVGSRPGEKLFEELFDAEEKRLTASVPGVLRAVPNVIPLHELRDLFKQLAEDAAAGNAAAVSDLLRSVLFERGAPHRLSLPTVAAILAGKRAHLQPPTAGSISGL